MANESHFVPMSQISFPLEAVFPSRGNTFSTNPLLRPVATDFLFSGNDIFFEAIIEIRGRQVFKKILFLLVETVLFNFFRY